MSLVRTYEELYQKYLDEGYYPQWANRKALRELASYSQVQLLNFNVPLKEPFKDFREGEFHYLEGESLN